METTPAGLGRGELLRVAEVVAQEKGISPGEVLEAPSGEHGFGYDPVFKPEGVATSSAELTADEKNAISHRSRAFGALVEELRRLYG